MRGFSSVYYHAVWYENKLDRTLLVLHPVGPGLVDSYRRCTKHMCGPDRQAAGRFDAVRNWTSSLKLI